MSHSTVATLNFTQDGTPEDVSIKLELLLLRICVVGIRDLPPQVINQAIVVLARNFETSDVNLFRHTLDVFQELHTKVKIFSQESFTGPMKFALLKQLFDTLVAKSHNSLREDIIHLVYALMSVEPNIFLEVKQDSHS